MVGQLVVSPNFWGHHFVANVYARPTAYWASLYNGDEFIILNASKHI